MNKTLWRKCKSEDEIRKRLSQFQKGYLAGMIDGEGTITLTRRGKRRDIEARIIIHNCNFFILDTIKDWLGGCRKKISMDTRRKKQCYRLEITKQVTVMEILKMLLCCYYSFKAMSQHSMLCIKYQQAVRVLEYLERKRTILTFNKDRMEQLVNEVRELNKKGPKDG